MPLKRAGRLSENKGNSSSDLQQCTRIDVYRSSVVLVVVEVLKMFYESQQIVTRPRHGRIQAPPSAPDFEIPDPRFRKLSHQQPPRKVSRLYQWRLKNYRWANLRYPCLRWNGKDLKIHDLNSSLLFCSSSLGFTFAQRRREVRKFEFSGSLDIWVRFSLSGAIEPHATSYGRRMSSRFWLQCD